MRVLCLTDFPVVNGRWLWDWLPDCHDEVEFVSVPRSRIMAQCARSLAYAQLSTGLAIEAHRRVRHGQYDVVVAWEIKNGYSFAILRAVLRRTDPKFIILAFGLRGLPARWRLLTRYVIRWVDAITVPSLAEAELYAKMLSIPLRRVFVCPNGQYDLWPLRELSIGSGAYEKRQPVVFSGGYSYRDFDVLIEAARGLKARIEIVAPVPRYRVTTMPANVEWFSPLPSQEYLRRLASADIVVIPLKPVLFATGLVDLLSAMSAGRPVVVTHTGPTAEYVENHRNGILVNPGDSQQLHNALWWLTEHADEMVRIGQNARDLYLSKYTFPLFARRVRDVLRQVAERGEDN